MSMTKNVLSRETIDKIIVEYVRGRADYILPTPLERAITAALPEILANLLWSEEAVRAVDTRVSDDNTANQLRYELGAIARKIAAEARSSWG